MILLSVVLHEWNFDRSNEPWAYAVHYFQRLRLLVVDHSRLLLKVATRPEYGLNSHAVHVVLVVALTWEGNEASFQLLHNC